MIRLKSKLDMVQIEKTLLEALDQLLECSHANKPKEFQSEGSTTLQICLDCGAMRLKDDSGADAWTRPQLLEHAVLVKTEVTHAEMIACLIKLMQRTKTQTELGLFQLLVSKEPEFHHSTELRAEYREHMEFLKEEEEDDEDEDYDGEAEECERLYSRPKSKKHSRGKRRK